MNKKEPKTKSNQITPIICSTVKISKEKGLNSHKKKIIEKSKYKFPENDTKNVPKNFGTAISIFIKKNP